MKSSTIFVIAAISFCGWGAVRSFKAVTFKQECGGYLKRAADANTVDLAKVEMTRAITYLDQHGLTTGYTSVLWKTPDEDVGYWYSNLRASLAELDSIPPEASPLERSNVLMKLRETLMDNGKNGDYLTIPEGLSACPSNTAFFWWGWISFGVAAVVLSGAAAKY